MRDEADAATRPSDGTEPVDVALGSNLGARDRHLDAARRGLESLPGVRDLRASPVEETAPLGDRLQPAYLNQMVRVRTTLAPLALLDALLDIERREGRTRDERWASRTLDCDIVRFGDRRITHPRLTVPHPELERRDFWRRGLDALDAADARAVPEAQDGPPADGSGV